MRLVSRHLDSQQVTTRHLSSLGPSPPSHLAENTTDGYERFSNITEHIWYTSHVSAVKLQQTAKQHYYIYMYYVAVSERTCFLFPLGTLLRASAEICLLQSGYLFVENLSLSPNLSDNLTESVSICFSFLSFFPTSGLWWGFAPNPVKSQSSRRIISEKKSHFRRTPALWIIRLAISFRPWPAWPHSLSLLSFCVWFPLELLAFFWSLRLSSSICAAVFWR